MNNTLDKTRETKVLIAQIRAFCDTVHSILNNSNAAEIARYTSYKGMARMHNDFVSKAEEVLQVSSLIYTFDVDQMLGSGDTTWPNQKKILEQVLIASKMLLASLEGSCDFVNDEFDNLQNFLQSRLRASIFQKPEKEIEVQNAIEALLLGRGLSKGVDYDRESGKLEFSGKEYIPDFVIKKLSLCIEVKLLREGRRSKVIEEISADITAYKKVYSRQLYVVYDLGVIQNEAEFKHDIEAIDGVKVVIVKQ